MSTSTHIDLSHLSRNSQQGLDQSSGLTGPGFTKQLNDGGGAGGDEAAVNIQSSHDVLNGKRTRSDEDDDRDQIGNVHDDKGGKDVVDEDLQRLSRLAAKRIKLMEDGWSKEESDIIQSTQLGLQLSLALDQAQTLYPSHPSAFTSYRDAVDRLLPYHIWQIHDEELTSYNRGPVKEKAREEWEKNDAVGLVSKINNIQERFAKARRKEDDKPAQIAPTISLINSSTTEIRDQLQSLQYSLRAARIAYDTIDSESRRRNERIARERAEKERQERAVKEEQRRRLAAASVVRSDAQSKAGAIAGAGVGGVGGASASANASASTSTSASASLNPATSAGVTTSVGTNAGPSFNTHSSPPVRGRGGPRGRPRGRGRGGMRDTVGGHGISVANTVGINNLNSTTLSAGQSAGTNQNVAGRGSSSSNTPTSKAPPTSTSTTTSSGKGIVTFPVAITLVSQFVTLGLIKLPNLPGPSNPPGTIIRTTGDKKTVILSMNLGMCDQSQLQAMAKLLNIKNNNNSPGPTASGSGTGKAASMTKTTGSSEPASGGKGDRG